MSEQDYEQLTLFPADFHANRSPKPDDRYLWPEMLRVIKELRPSWVVGENVANILNLALDDVLSDLEVAGYKTRAFMVPARSIGALHQRYRFAIVAYSDGDGRSGRSCKEVSEGRERHQVDAPFTEGQFPRGGCWSTEPGVGRVVDGVPYWMDRIKSLGNAVVPQQFYPFFKYIHDIEEELHGA